MLKLDQRHAVAADAVGAGIRESGKYIGTITRAEKLVSSKGTVGLGLSFRADNGQTADYLDLYHSRADGEALSSMKTVHAIMCCAKVSEADEGPIKTEKWDTKAHARVPTTATGYPALMGKRIGLLLQKTLETDDKGNDRDRMQIFGVFNAETELTASEMYARATTPAKLPAMLDALLAKPVRDNRKGGSSRGRSGGDSAGFDRFDDMPPAEDMPF